MFEALLSSRQADFSSPVWGMVSAGARDLVSRILNKDKRARLSLEDILHHAWMVDHVMHHVTVGAPLSAGGRLRSRSVNAVHASPAAAAATAAVAAIASEGGCQVPPSPSPSPERVGRPPSLSLTEESPSAPAASQAPGRHLMARTTSRDIWELPPDLPPEAAALAAAHAAERRTSAHIFFSPEDPELRKRLHGFVDLFKRAEDSFTLLLKAGDADEASSQWDAFCAGLRLLNAYLEENASRDGPLFLGREPSLAEAATAPALFRMIATVRGGEGEEGVAIDMACD